MELIRTIDDLKANIKVMDNYLSSKDHEEIKYAKERVRMGTCFVVVNSKTGYRFYPSRFIGYADNSIEKHERNNEKDGRKTNPAISKIIGCKPEYDDELEEAYLDYCAFLGLKSRKKGAFGVKRKYWKLTTHQ